MGTVDASRADVARLFGRAAFGATAADLSKWEGQPYATVVSSLVDVLDPATRPPQVDDVTRIVQETNKATLDKNQLWWLERMRTTMYPLEERMTLFLHDHFATAVLASGFPDPAMVLHQNQTLRLRSLGNFQTLCNELTIDPAMLYWLSGQLNRKGKPNENYARELFELFTLGTIPQVYGENDIRQAARALTGWSVDANRNAKFTPANHDTTNKSVLGKPIVYNAADKGATEYQQVVAAALGQAVAPRYLAYKLVLSFGYVPTTTDVLINPDAVVADVATALAPPAWDLRAAVRTLLLHDGFRSADATAGRQSFRQPVELAVHAAKALGFGANNAQILTLLGRMSQKPFQPPNVSGWPVGHNWLSTTTMIARYDLGITAYNLWAALNKNLRVVLPASGDLAGWAALLGLAGLTTNTEAALRNYLGSPGTTSEAEKQKGVLALIVSSPDWMVM